jgi:hypothetical protein
VFIGWDWRLRVAVAVAACAVAVIVAVVSFPAGALPKNEPMSASDMATNLQFPGRPYRVVVSPDRRHRLYVVTQYIDQDMGVFVATAGKRHVVPRAIYLGPQHAVSWRGNATAMVGSNPIGIPNGHLDADDLTGPGDGLGVLMAAPPVILWGVMVFLMAIGALVLLLAMLFMPAKASVQEAVLADWP